MAAGDSGLSICSDALLMLGAKPISSFTEGTDESSIADRLYADVRDQAISIYPWSFAFKKTQLARLVDAPNSQFKYAYQLPSDRIEAPRAVYYANSIGIPTINDYQIMGDQLLTNQEEIWVDYKYSVPEYSMPSYFIQLLKYMMAWHLALPITDQTEKAQYWQQVATGTPGENGRGGFMRQAMSVDGQNQPNNSIHDFALINVRY